MAEGIELGKAYVQVVPSTEGISGKLAETFGAEGANSGNTFSRQFGANLASMGVAAAATAAVSIGKALANALGETIEQYGNYEQLTGGVEKLFGESADLIYSYAEKAYEKAGVSSNEYMEQITSFSASLISSLDGDTKKAAKIGNMAIEDMSDNANTFGTDIASIQNAYQGFAKQNYTMLDNLRLGYGGTKTEMERLIADANKLKEANGEMADLSIESYADIIEAIHMVQVEMKITGTTAEEASATIEGSSKTAKAAWTNVMTALGDKNGDLKGAVADWADAAKTSIENTGAVISNVLGNIPEFVGGVFSALSEIINEHYVTVNGQAVASGDLIKANNKYYEEQAEYVKNTLTPLYENQSYLNQLTSLADEYGNVAEENFGQVDAIIEILNEKYGTQMERQGNVIQNYDTEIAKIKELIDTEIQEENITRILENKETALANLTAATEAYKTLQEKIARWEAQAAQYTDTTSAGYLVLQNAISYAREGLSEFGNAYANAEIIATQALNNWTLAQEGHAEQAIFLNAEELGSITSTVEAIKTAYDEEIAHYQTNIDEWTKIMATQDEEAAKNTASLIEQEKAKKAAAEETRDAQVKAAEEANKKVSEQTQKLADDQAAILFDARASLEKGINNAWDGVKESTDTAAEDVKKKAKGATDFTWSLPNLKMPHFSASGQFSLNPLSIPTFGIDWYSKAMDEAAVLNGATIFGSADGKLLGGGEVGSEVISGEDHLINLINQSVASVMNPTLERIASLLGKYLPEAARNDMQVVLDGDAIVRAIAPKMDSELGRLSTRKTRGM